MSELKIRIDNYVEADGEPAPRVYARIQRLDARGRSVPQTLQHELVPLSNRPEDARGIELSPGDYNVEVRLPSGELLTDAVRLSESGHDLVLAATTPAREWLGWQHGKDKAGSSAQADANLRSARATRGEAPVLPKPRASRRRRMADRVSPLPTLRRSNLTERLAEVMQRVGLRLVNGVIGPSGATAPLPWNPQQRASLQVNRPLHWLGSGEGIPGVDVMRDDPWRSLPALHGSTAHILDALHAGRERLLIEPAAQDSAAAMFRVPNHATRRDDSDFASANRNFVAVEREQGVELVCLPTPWLDSWTEQEVAVEVGVQRPKFEAQFASAIAVRDPHLAVLLGFLSSGALPAAKRLAETASGLLYEKSVNPLAAAAGGYALVSGAIDDERQPWHHWIENLMERFAHVPDGAIQFATMRLRLRKDQADVDAAREAFKLAYRRGLPFYSLGLRWLLEGLQRFSDEDAEAKEMATAIRRLAARLHPQSPFTILRLGRR